MSDPLHGAEIVRELGGSSDSRTFLIRKDGKLRVRKFASRRGREKLEFQAEWYRTASTRTPLLLGIERSEEFFSLDLEFVENSINLFELLQMNPSAAVEAFSQVLTWLNPNRATRAAHVELPQNRDIYLREKLIGKINQLADLSPALRDALNASTLTLNGKKLMGYQNLVAAIFNDHKLLAGFARVRPTQAHGDLTFENILVREGVVMPLDPNDENWLECELVDLGKLLQSISSRYELLKNANNLTVTTDSISYELTEPDVYLAMRKMFEGYFEKNFEAWERRSLELHHAVHLARLLPYQWRAQDHRLWPLFGEFIRTLNRIVEGAT